MTQAGTTCPSKAEDAVKDAFARSVAWQQFTETAGDPSPITAAGESIHFNSVPIPADGHAFSVDELQERRVAMLILTDPEDGFSIVPTDAEGVLLEGGRVVAIVERFLRDSEQGDPEIDRNREMLDAMVGMCREAAEYLLETMGQRWLRGIHLKQPPSLNHYKDADVSGRYQQAAISIDWGQRGNESE